MDRGGRSLVFAGLASIALLTAPAAWGLDQIPVLTTGHLEEGPAAASGYLAWEQEGEKDPSIPDSLESLSFDVVVQAEGGAPQLINSPEVNAEEPDIDGTTLVYSESPEFTGLGELRFFDLVSGTHSDLPVGVNTRAGEDQPSLSGDWLLFRRRSGLRPAAKLQIVLFNLASGESRILDRSRTPLLMEPGAVRGNFVTWTKCTDVAHRCQLYLYDIATRSKTAVPNPRRRQQLASSLTADGTVFFSESRTFFCGRPHILWRYTSTGGRVRLLTLARGHDVWATSALPNADGSTTVFYDRHECDEPYGSDIYKIVVPSQASDTRAVAARSLVLRSRRL